MITPAQSRAARGLIEWSQEQLAEAAHLGLSTVRDFEKGRRTPSHNNLLGMKTALETAGVIFVAENGEGPGVRLKKKAGLEAKIADAKERAAEQIPEGPSPASGMAKLRRGKAEADLRNLKEKKRRKTDKDAQSIPIDDLNANNDQ